MACKVSLCPHPCRIITSNPSSFSLSSLLVYYMVVDASSTPSTHPSLCIRDLTRDNNSLSRKQRREWKLFDEANLKVRIDVHVRRRREGWRQQRVERVICVKCLCERLQSLYCCATGEQINTNVASVQECHKWRQQRGEGTIAAAWLFEVYLNKSQPC